MDLNVAVLGCCTFKSTITAQVSSDIGVKSLAALAQLSEEPDPDPSNGIAETRAPMLYNKKHHTIVITMVRATGCCMIHLRGANRIVPIMKPIISGKFQNRNRKNLTRCISF